MTVMRTVAIVGAGSDRRKFGNKSVRAHALAGWAVHPVHPSEVTVEGLPVHRSVSDIPVQLDRISVYLPPAITLKALESFATKPGAEVWFNPGSHDEAVLEKAKSLGLKVVTACSIVDVGFSPSQFEE
jgi:hypothetical protein